MTNEERRRRQLRDAETLRLVNSEPEAEIGDTEQNGYPMLGDDDVIELPLSDDLESGRPYFLGCCDCALVHQIYARITDDNRVEIRLVRDDDESKALRSFTARTGTTRFIADGIPPSGTATEARPMPAMTQRRRRTADNDDAYETVTGHDGRPVRVLKDGATVRVSFMDAQRSRANAGIAEAQRITQAVVDAELARMQGDGSPGNPYIITTSVGRFNDAQLALHRPGWRTSDSTPPWQPGDDEFDPGGTRGPDELERHRRRLRRAAGVSNVSDPDNGDDDDGDDDSDDGSDVEDMYADALKGLDPRERARAIRIIEDGEAWRGPPAPRRARQRRDALNPEPGTGLPTRPLSSIPPRGGNYPASAEGQSCTVDGQAGVVRNGVCRPNPAPGPTRSGSGDTAPLTQDEASAITGEAWRSYVDDLTNAWRTS